jgi:transcriptional regulator with XRE-family HTH domain
MTVADRLKELRKENNITQSELANMLDMAKGTVAMWEMGKRNPSFEALEKMII